MTATGHAIIGTVIAAKVGNPALAIPLAFASHFLADALPHWDTGYHRGNKTKNIFFIQSAIDVFVGFFVSFVLLQVFFPTTNLFYAFFMIIIAQLPDWLTAPYLFLNLKIPPFTWMYNLQKIFDTHLGMPWGVINQAIVLAAVIIFGFSF